MAKVVFQNQPQETGVSEQLFEKLIANNNTLERGLMTTEEGIKDELVLRLLDTPISFQDPSCEFTPSTGDVTIDGNILKVYKYEFQRNLCMEDARKVLQWAKLPAGSLAEYQGTPEIMNAVANRYAALISEANNKLYWLGMNAVSEFASVSSTVRNAYLGILPRAIADSDSLKVSLPKFLTIANVGITVGANTTITHGSGENANLSVGDIVTFSSNVGGMTQIRGLSGRVIAKPSATTTQLDLNTTGFSAHTSGGTVGAITQDNVADVLQQVYDLVPEAVKNQEDFRMLVSGKIADLYQYSQAVAGGNGVDSKYFVGKKELDFLGVRIERMPHWLPNCILAARAESLKLGYDTTDDFNTMKIMYMGDTTMDELYSIRVSMKTGENYTFGSELVIVTPAIHA